MARHLPAPIGRVQIEHETYDTGWIENTVTADWSNVTLGSTGRNTDLVHGLGTHLRDLDINLFVSTDGTDSNSFNIGTSDFSTTIVANYGHTIFEVDANTLKVQTGATGLLFHISGTGIGDGITNDNWYYRIVVKKKQPTATVIGNAFVIPKFDTGWVANTDYSAQIYGNVLGGDVIHNLSSNLADIDVKFLISTDGTDTNSYLVPLAPNNTDTSIFSVTCVQIDQNTVRIQDRATSGLGILYISKAGVASNFNTNGTHYRVIVRKWP